MAERAEEAIEVIKQAMRLNPVYPPYYLWNLGHAYLLTGRYKEAIETLKKTLARTPDFWPSHVLLAASYSAVGRIDEARAERAEVLRINPDFTLDSWRHKRPFKNPEELDCRFEKLRRAGFH